MHKNKKHMVSIIRDIGNALRHTDEPREMLYWLEWAVRDIKLLLQDEEKLFDNDTIVRFI